MQSEKSPLSPRVPSHSGSSIISSYGSVPIYETSNRTASDIFHESLIRKYYPSTISYNDHFPEESVVSQAKPTVFRRIYNKIAKLVVEWWLWEILSWVLSAVCMCGIATVLGLFNERALPARWPGGVTLNAYISVFSGAAKFTLAVPLDSSLGQLKWLWFRSDRPRRLADFERFDNASKGPWGAFTLLLSGSGRSLASVGALTTLLSLGLDPFFQQVVSYPQRPGPLQISSVDRAIGYTPNGLINYRNGTRSLGDDLMVQTYLESFFLENMSAPNPPYDCPSGQCSWTPYKTLGVCSSCVDASALLSFDCGQETGDWLPAMGALITAMYPNESQYPDSYSCGYFMNAGGDGRILMNGYSLGTNASSNSSALGPALLLRVYEMQNFDSKGYYWQGTGYFNNTQSPLEHFIVVSGNDAATVYANATPVAQECMLSWCEKTIRSNFSRGQYNEELLSSFIGVNASQVPAYYETRLAPGGQSMEYALFQNITVFGSEPNTSYTITELDQLGARFTLGNFFPSFGTVQNISSSLELMTLMRPGLLPRTFDLSYNAWAPPYNISTHVATWATSMTNVIRTTGNNVEKVFGSGIPETYISISWGWFVFPLVLEVVTLVLLLATIRKSNRMGDMAIWKGSSLTTLANGLSNEVKRELGNSTEVIEFRERAQNILVSLTPVSNGFTLVREGETLRTELKRGLGQSFPTPIITVERTVSV